MDSETNDHDQDATLSPGQVVALRVAFQSGMAFSRAIGVRVGQAYACVMAAILCAALAACDAAGIIPLAATSLVWSAALLLALALYFRTQPARIIDRLSRSIEDGSES